MKPSGNRSSLGRRLEDRMLHLRSILPSVGAVPINEQIVGKCGKCGGIVTVPVIFWSVVAPVPQCKSCGARVDQTVHLPTLPMR